MHSLVLTTLFASLALTAPMPAPAAKAAPQVPGIDSTLFSGIGDLIGNLDMAGSTKMELDEDKTCRPVYYVVARGSMEPGTIGPTVAPPICKGLKAKFGEATVGCQGMTSAEYSGAIWDNLMPIGTSTASVTGGVAAFKRVSQKCPNSILVSTGYSQGAALLHNVVPELPAEIKNKLVGVVLFGDTKNKQSNAMIQDFPKEKTITYCEKDDGVCWGGLSVTGGHVAYTKNGDEQRAIDWLSAKISAAMGK